MLVLSLQVTVLAEAQHDDQIRGEETILKENTKSTSALGVF